MQFDRLILEMAGITQKFIKMRLNNQIHSTSEPWYINSG